MKNIATTIRFIILLVFAFPLISSAHPGHGETEGYTIIHYFTEPMHAVITLSSMAVFYLLFRLVNKNSKRLEK